MMRATWLRLVPIALLTLVLVAPAQAAGTNIAVLRAESLDAIGADMNRVAQLFDTEVTGDVLLAPVMGALGITETDWLDRSRPLALLLPMDGMALGFRGFVAVLPVVPDTSPGAVVGQLGGEGAEPDDQGVYTLQLGGQPLSLLQRDDYVIVGGTPALVLGVDVRSALNLTGAPAGNLVLDVHIEPIRPMAQMGLAMGRQMLAQQAAQSAPTTEEDVPEGEDPPEEGEAVTPAFDPQAMMSMLGLYFDLLQDLLNNTDRLQISLEVASDDSVAHMRLIPRGASTLEGLLKAQKGGLPRLAGHIEQEGAMGVWAGQIQFTPAFVEAAQGYTERYVEAMRQMGGMFEGTMGPGWFSGFAEALAGSLQSWTDCVRGDFAGAVNFVPEGGFQFTQVMGAADADACKTLITDVGRAVAALPAGEDGEPYMSLTENAFQYGDITATRQEMKMLLPPGDEFEEVREMVSTWFGGDSLVSYYAISGDLVLNVTGAESEQRLKALIDRMAAKKSVPSITPETFAPLEVGPGVFGFMDFGQLFGMLRESFGELPDAGGKLPFADLAPGQGRLVFGARFDAQGLNLELALPFALIEAFGKLVGSAVEAAAPPPADTQG